MYVYMYIYMYVFVPFSQVAVVPSGVDVDAWARARANFTASGGVKKRHAFFFCCLVNHQVQCLHYY